MKTFKNKLVTVFVFIFGSIMVISCGSDEVLDAIAPNCPSEERIPNHATMVLDGSITAFDATRANDATWEHDDKIYLQFSVGSSVVDGTATYDATTQEWNIQYYGTLTNGTESKCEAYYFENAGESTRLTIHLNERTAIYVDKSASYLFEDGVLKVTANLTPMTGRIRFKGDGSESYRFSGMSFYNTYNITSNTFTSKVLDLHSSKTNTDGYSEYYYGFFADESNKYLCFDDYDNCVSYTRSLDEQALAVGRSGYLNIPTMKNCNGWDLFTFKDFNVSNVKFRMIRVITETSYYYVGETEVTQELWTAIMSSNPSTFKGNNMPVETVSSLQYTYFLLGLNQKTGEEFFVPSKSDWLFAAKGAGASKGFKYSGSNELDDVAWYSGNSDRTTHPVKTKLPNEIGIYDMNGNVNELTSDYYYDSTSDWAYYYHYYGGSFIEMINSPFDCIGNTNSAHAWLGIRLFLK